MIFIVIADGLVVFCNVSFSALVLLGGLTDKKPVQPVIISSPKSFSLRALPDAELKWKIKLEKQKVKVINLNLVGILNNVHIKQIKCYWLINDYLNWLQYLIHYFNNPCDALSK